MPRLISSLAVSLLVVSQTLADPSARPGAPGPWPSQPAQLVGIRIDSIVEVIPPPASAPRPGYRHPTRVQPGLTLVSGEIELSDPGTGVPARVSVHVGSYATQVFPGDTRFSLLIANQGRILPRVRAFQEVLNVALEAAPGSISLPPGWSSAQR